jgi:hypothetical protein
MSACRFGCDELYERGYISVDSEGKLMVSGAAQANGHVGEYTRQYLSGRMFARSMADREKYFAWHRDNRFRGETV